jgi:DNA-binding transcriptional MocR family regulator
MDKFNITNLKKQLSEKTKEELIKEIATLCQTFPQVKEYYQAQGSNIQEVAKKYKDIIEKEFIEGKTRNAPKARFSVARKALNDFKKLTNEPELIADIMMTYVESISWFNTEYNPDAEEFYTRSEDMFETVLAFIKKHQLNEKFSLRAYRIVESATEGWGHRDSLEERYMEVYGDFVE